MNFEEVDDGYDQEESQRNEAREEFKQLAYTHMLKKKVTDGAVRALEVLVRQCESTTDPKVALAVGRYKACLAMQTVLNTGEWHE